MISIITFSLIFTIHSMLLKMFSFVLIYIVIQSINFSICLFNILFDSKWLLTRNYCKIGYTWRLDVGLFSWFKLQKIFPTFLNQLFSVTNITKYKVTYLNFRISIHFLYHSLPSKSMKFTKFPICNHKSLQTMLTSNIVLKTSFQITYNNFTYIRLQEYFEYYFLLQ